MSKFFSKRRFHLSSPANLMPSVSSPNSNPKNSSKSTNSSASASAPCGYAGPFSPQAKKRLTRQRKLRHLTAVDLGPPEGDDGDRSKSLPESPHRLPHHWSLSAVPQPLPLPNDDFRFPADGHYRDGCCRSQPCNQNANDHGSSTSSKSSTCYRRRDTNGKNLHREIRLDVPARSAPTTTFTSPTLSPKRFSTVDIFDSAFVGLHEFHLSPPSNPSTRRTPSHDHRSSIHSPTLQSPYLNNNNTSKSCHVHPLPLPPGASRTICNRHSLDSKSDAQSIKGQWQKGKLLGRGTYGSVYEATNRETGSLCAMKEVDVIPDDSKSAECIRQLEQEIRVLRCLEHPNIVQYLGSEVVEDRFCIYLEYVHPGSINKYVRDHCLAITESVVRNFTRHILSGLAYLHSKKTVHRDIKGANLLVDSSGVVKLADFGLAKHLSAHVTNLSLKGSPHWMAPEVLQAVMRKEANLEQTFTMDIWSLGCTVIEMVTGKPPWSEFNGVQAMFNVLNRSPPIPETLSAEGKDFLNRCLQRNPENRLSAALLLEHPFVRNSFDHNLPLCKFSISHNPRDPTPCYKDTMQHSSCTRVEHGRLQFRCGTPRKSHSENTMDHLPPTRHSPRSTLEVLPSESLPEMNFIPHYCGNSQIPYYSRITTEGGRTYSLPTTPSREYYLL